MEFIKVNCSCGAKMSTEGKDIYSCLFPFDKFIKAHEICRRNYVIRRLEDEDNIKDYDPIFGNNFVTKSSN